MYIGSAGSPHSAPLSLIRHPPPSAFALFDTNKACREASSLLCRTPPGTLCTFICSPIDPAVPWSLGIVTLSGWQQYQTSLDPCLVPASTLAFLAFRAGMALKRKRSASELCSSPSSSLSSSSSVLSSPPSAIPLAMDVAPHPFSVAGTSTPAHLHSRTRKRFRDSRPSDEEVHRKSHAWPAP